MANKITKNTLEVNPDINKNIKQQTEVSLREILGAADNKEANAKIDELRAGVLSRDPKNVSRSKAQVKALVGDIILKVFQQDLFTNNLLYGESLIKSFSDGYLDFGNSKEYIFEPLTGFGNHAEASFIPDSLTDIPVDSTVISFYKPDGKTLNPNSKKWVKELTLIEKNLIQYFLSGKTFEFIAKKVSNMAESLLIGQVHEILNFLSTTAINKVINLDTDSKFTPAGATNAAESWVKIWNIINDMSQASKDYNYDSTCEIPRRSNTSDLVIFGTPAVFQFLKNMKAFIYHSDLFQPIQNLTDSNYFIVPRKYVISDEATMIQTSADYYLDNNTIIILDKSECIKILYVLEEFAEQFFGKNLAVARFKHLWFTWGILKWAKICKITSTKLLTDVNPN